MLVSEKEARSVRCTPALVVLIMEAERLSGLQARTENVSPHCIGAKCMQWRWNKVKKPNGSYAEYGAEKEAAHEAPRGYCGLAGFIG